jgi:hypothetical protein
MHQKVIKNPVKYYNLGIMVHPIICTPGLCHFGWVNETWIAIYDWISSTIWSTLDYRGTTTCGYHVSMILMLHAQKLEVLFQKIRGDATTEKIYVEVPTCLHKHGLLWIF